MATWSPAPGELFRLPETETDVAYTVSAVIEDPETEQTIAAESYSGAITPEQTVLAINAGADGLTVSADSLAGLFPIEGVAYLLDGERGEVGEWDALPAEAEQIIAFTPSSQRDTTYQLAVTATFPDGTEEEAVYDLVIEQDWDAGRDRLKEEVDARRG